MLEPPDLSEDLILTSARDRFGIDLAEITFLPLGCDAHAWAYRTLTADGTAYFLKLRRRFTNPSALMVPRYLRDRGVTRVVAPIPARGGSLSIDVGEFAVMLYPFIEGTSATDHGMAEQHWVSFGTILKQIHATVPSPELTRSMNRENFVPQWSSVVRRLDAHLTAQSFADPIERELAAFWHSRRSEIHALLERAERLGQRLRATRPPLVICHTDIHTWNTMIDTEERLWIVDWDETLLAPKEVDLMFAVGGIGAGVMGPEQESWFFAGYGPTTVDPLALAYYRYARAIGDIGGFGEQIALVPDASEADKHDALRLLESLFEPGNMVAIACATTGIDV